MLINDNYNHVLGEMNHFPMTVNLGFCSTSSEQPRSATRGAQHAGSLPYKLRHTEKPCFSSEGETKKEDHSDDILYSTTKYINAQKIKIL
jgi:hypothetical protein